MEPIKINFNPAQMLKTSIAAARVGGVFNFKCYGPDGILKWEEDAKNLVPTAGLNHIVDVILNSGTQITTWYIGLKNTGTPAAGDTLASHASWTENSNYTGDRKSWTGSAAASGSTNNSSNKASFSINADSQTIAGAFIASASTGTTGTLLCAADFTGGNKSLGNGDTLEVTYTFSAADDGA